MAGLKVEDLGFFGNRTVGICEIICTFVRIADGQGRKRDHVFRKMSMKKAVYFFSGLVGWLSISTLSAQDTFRAERPTDAPGVTMIARDTSRLNERPERSYFETGVVADAQGWTSAPGKRRTKASKVSKTPRAKQPLAPAFTQQPANGEHSPHFAPEVVWGLWFDFFFDNREYKSAINWPQTIFGTRVAPEIGVRWGSHSIMGGISLLADFGAKPFETDNEIFAYYQYHSPKFRAYAGVIPRYKMIGEYSPAFFSDSVKYFDPNLTGLLLQYAGGRGYVEFGADWNSKFGAITREKFLLFSSGRINYKWLYAGYNLSMYHHAGNFDTDGVVDNVLIYPFVGIDLREKTGMQQLSLQVGWLQAFQNDRKYVGEYVTPGGFQAQLRVQKWNFGIDNTIYAGKNLMPYWDAPAEGLDYGPGLYWGEPFYRTQNFYDRLEIYWQPIANDRMSLRVASVHHYDGTRWGWQQKVLFRVNLGQNRLIGKRK